MSLSSVRRSVGPVEVYAYHDYGTAPWHSPLYAGVWVGDRNMEVCIGPDSSLRPFCGGHK